MHGLELIYFHVRKCIITDSTKLPNVEGITFKKICMLVNKI